MRILLTGAAGFIGSCMLSAMNRHGWYDIWISDDFTKIRKNPNYAGKKFSDSVPRSQLFEFLNQSIEKPDFVVHLGAHTDTTEFNESVFEELNLGFSRKLWNYCTQHEIPFLYASSAATYGSGEKGYSDDHRLVPHLEPLNPYGWSKQKFDQWVLEQTNTPPQWYGFKFFNVYGPNEYHKGRMASVVFHGYCQVRENNKIRLFRSHKKEIPDGHQKRDFIYVKDVVDVLLHFMIQKPSSGIYNLGSGTARTFLDLALAVFRSLNLKPSVEWMDTPQDIRQKYQYYTCADIRKLRTVYHHPFFNLEEGVADYIRHYLIENKYF